MLVAIIAFEDAEAAHGRLNVDVANKLYAVLE